MNRFRRLAATALGALTVATLLPLNAPPASAALAAVSATDPSVGFPFWYADSTGMRLALCLDGAPPCFTTRPDLTQPASFPDNFPADGEAFYFIAEANLDRPVGKLAFYRAALEGAFLPDVAAGNQVVFTRIRFRIDALVPGASYTITHPYGVDTLTANGVGVINDTVDIGCLAPPCDGNFGAAMSGPVGPFLQWDPALGGAPPAGFIGSFGSPHAVTGSPNGTNFFRVVGPNVGGPGVNSLETNLFDVAGKLAPGASASLSPASLTFAGQRLGTPSGTSTATLTNAGGTPLSVSGVAIGGTNAADFRVVSDACTGTTVPSGGNCAIGVQFNPTGAGTRTAVLNVTDNAPGSPQVLALSGTGLAAVITPSPASIDFGSVKVDTFSSNRTVSLTNTGTDSAILGTVEVTGASATDFLIHEDNCAGLTLAAGQSCTVALSFGPTVTGIRSAQLSVASNLPTSPLNIPVRGNGTAPLVSFNPTSLSFGSQLIVLSTAEQRVTLTNRGNASLSIHGFSIGGANPNDFTISTNTCSTTLLAGRSCFITVKFNPLLIGSRTATLVLASDAPATNVRSVPLSGTGSLLII